MSGKGYTRNRRRTNKWLTNMYRSHFWNFCVGDCYSCLDHHHFLFFVYASSLTAVSYVSRLTLVSSQRRALHIDYAWIVAAANRKSRNEPEKTTTIIPYCSFPTTLRMGIKARLLRHGINACTLITQLQIEHDEFLFVSFHSLLNRFLFLSVVTPIGFTLPSSRKVVSDEL